VSGAELGKHLEGQFAKFWMPDAYVFIDQIPRTSTGKFLKTRLRETYGSMLEVDPAKTGKK
jgi:fatty-acyl-CoA synthase